MAKFEYVDSQKNLPGNTNPVVKMCRWLEVSTSGFYHWLSRPQSATAARRQALTARVVYFFEASDGTYGYRRIHADLVCEGTECSPELVRQIMRVRVWWRVSRARSGSPPTRMPRPPRACRIWWNGTSPPTGRE